MTPKQSKAVHRHLHVIAHHLGLSDWEINLRDDPPGEDNLASVECVYGRRIAHVRLCPDWWEWSAAQRHHVLVHEMTHIPFDAASTYLHSTLPGLLGAPAWTAVEEAYRHHMEHAVDQIASALAPHLPVMEDV